MKVKICANKSVIDAKMCVDAGADLIGVLVGQEHNSTDFINKETAKSICSFVDKKCDVVLVTHLTNANEIIDLTNFIGNNYIQLHSEISETEVEKIVKKLPQIKLIRVIHIDKSGEILTNINQIKYADYYLLDSFNIKENKVGGTGCVHNWEASAKLVKSLNKPVFLAGGLTPDNVKEAILKVQPYGVDVNTGCKLNGIKNAKKVLDFVRNAKSVE